MFYHASTDTQGLLPKEERKRRRMDQTGDNYQAVRERGVCPGCWMRRIKCDYVIPCRQCISRNYSPDFCCRDRINKISTHHPKMATEFIDVYRKRNSIESWDLTESPKAIELWHGLNDTSFRVTVTKYISCEAITDLFWKKPNGWQQLEHTPYGIRNEKRDLDPKALDEYVWAQVPHVLHQIDEKESTRKHDSVGQASDVRPARVSNKIWIKTMRTIYDYINDSPQPDSPEIRPLRTSLTLWTYTFLQYHGKSLSSIPQLNALRNTTCDWQIAALKRKTC